MRERSIVVPGSYFNVLYDWAFHATEKDEPAAKMINVMLYHYDNHYQNRILVDLVDRVIKQKRQMKVNLENWLPYSIDYLSELLLYAHGNNQIVNARKKLIEIGFISDQVPEEIPKFYSRSHSWYRLEVNNIYDWLEEVWYPLQKKQVVYSPRTAEVKKVIQEVTSRMGLPINDTPPQPVKGIGKQVDALGKFYIHIHNKNASFEFDADRKKAVSARLKTAIASSGEVKGFGTCLQAIIGNVLSDFHQGRHPKNMLGEMNSDTGTKGKVYDDIGEHIFKNAKKFEMMIENAENVGVTPEVAIAEYQKVQKGEASKYSKKVRKEAQKATMAQETMSAEQFAEVKPYRLFAREISSFFSTETIPAKEILQTVLENAYLMKLGDPLDRLTLLFDALVHIRTQQTDDKVTEKSKAQMKEFSHLFFIMKVKK